MSKYYEVILDEDIIPSGVYFVKYKCWWYIPYTDRNDMYFNLTLKIYKATSFFKLCDWLARFESNNILPRGKTHHAEIDYLSKLGEVTAALSPQPRTRKAKGHDAQSE